MQRDRQIEHYKTLVKKLMHEVTHDQLTGLANRKGLQQAFNKALVEAKKHHLGFAVLVIDVDKFKTINDTLGHTAGDSILQMVAAGLKQNVRSTDTVARIGGDEFVIILRNIKSNDDVVTIAEKLKNLFPETVRVNDNNIPISFSIGICLYSINCQDYESLFTHADEALYAVKQNGRNDYRIYG